jgi:hypothetical protein
VSKRTSYFSPKIVAVAACFAGCAAQQQSTPAPQATPTLPAEAQLAPVQAVVATAAAAVQTPVAAATPALADDGEPAEDGVSAGALLRRAFDFFKRDDNAAAANAFRAAIATGSLNDAGRALAYWHVYVCEQSLTHNDRAADALSSFVVVAQDVLEIREHLRYAEDDSGDFVDRFDLKRRLARARAMLSVAWAGETSGFGRSAEAPVPVHSSAEMNYFLELAPPCARAQDRRIQSSPKNAPGASNVAEVNLSCEGSQGQASYFFQVVEDD